MFDLGSMDLASLVECSAMLSRCGEDADSLEAAAASVVTSLYESLRDKQTGEPALALVRLYKTHRSRELDPGIIAHLRAGAASDVESSDVTCLTLMASAGVEPQWNDRRLSRDHQAIPLSSPEALRSSPMVSALFAQLGLDTADFLGPGPVLFRPGLDGSCGVFHVAEARRSPYVPAQDFVETYGVRSVLGFGGVLPDGNMFAVVMFATVPVPAETADLFATLAFSVNLAILPFAERRVFEGQPDPAPGDPGEREARTRAASETALRGLLRAQQKVVVDQAAALETAARDAQDRADALQRSQERVVTSDAFKSAILDAAMDCLVTIDESGRVLEFNAAAERTFGYSREHALGRTVAELLIPTRQHQAHYDGIALYLRTGESQILNERIELNALRADGTEIPVELAVTRAGVDAPAVFVGFLRDLSARRAVEAALAEESQRSAHIARTLQTSLLPPALPDIDGLDLAATYRAAGEGFDVGGDFYDVFEISDNDWAFALGDVMGKGPEAAVVTALARYTIRAAAMRTSNPVGVLSMLNEAIYRQYPERPCTAIYGRLRRAQAGFDLVLGSGGHVPALLRKADGNVVETSVSGMLLGPFQPWAGTAQELHLTVGDLLLLYSDGVTESRNGRTLFGTERLTEVLAATNGMKSSETIDALITAVSNFATEASDDVAILAIRIDDVPGASTQHHGAAAAG